MGDPTYVKPAEFLDTNLMLENIGNSELTYTLTVIEDNGPAGWLGVSGFSGSIPSGLAGTEIGTVHLNAGIAAESVVVDGHHNLGVTIIVHVNDERVFQKCA